MEEWENIQRIILSLALKSTTQNIIIGKLRFKTEQDQQVWGECSRLLANCIIYYNASILSNMLKLSQFLSEGIHLELGLEALKKRKDGR